jgi:hypothetical protein
VGDDPVLVDDDCLDHPEHMRVVIKKDNQPARELLPFAHYCRRAKKVVIEPGQARYGSLFASVGRTGWLISEPGDYTVQLALEHEGKAVISNGLRLRVLPPRKYEEEELAQDYFSEQVGRVLNFDGSQYLIKGNSALREVTDKLADRRVARHAKLALALPLARAYKLVEFDMPSARRSESRGAIQVRPADDEATDVLASALANGQEAAETLGHIDYEYYVDKYTDAVAQEGDRKAAAGAQHEMLETLRARGVKASVLERIESRAEALSEPRPDERRRRRDRE